MFFCKKQMDSVSYDTQYKNLHTRTNRYDTVRYSTGKYTSLNKTKRAQRQHYNTNDKTHFKANTRNTSAQCHTDNAYNATQTMRTMQHKTTIQGQQTQTMRTMQHKTTLQRQQFNANKHIQCVQCHNALTQCVQCNNALTQCVQCHNALTQCVQCGSLPNTMLRTQCPNTP